MLLHFLAEKQHRVPHSKGHETRGRISRHSLAYNCDYFCSAPLHFKAFGFSAIPVEYIPPREALINSYRNHGRRLSALSAGKQATGRRFPVVCFIQFALINGSIGQRFHRAASRPLLTGTAGYTRITSWTGRNGPITAPGLSKRLP
jgi:hypothetical protein